MPNIRASALPDYFDCPRRSAANLLNTELKAAGYQLKWTPRNVAASVGTGLHSAAEYALDSLIDHQREPRESDCIEYGIVSLKGESLKGMEFDETTPNINHAEKQIAQLTRSFIYEVMPKYELIDPDTEFQMKADIGGGITLSGKCDFVNSKSLRDLKTGRISDYSAQAGAYSILNQAMGYNKPLYLVNDFLPRTAITKAYPGPTIIAYQVDEAEEAARQIIRHITAAMNEFKTSGDPWAFPANPKSMLCSEKYCKAFGTAFCKMGVRKK